MTNALLEELTTRLTDYVEWHECAIPRSHRDDYEQEVRIEGSKALLAQAKGLQSADSAQPKGAMK